MGRRHPNRTAPPRRTAVQRRAISTVEAIVEAAAHILEARGFEGYTTNAIAERAGASIGSLYQYFPNKDAITLALIERDAAVLVRNVREAAAMADWRAALRAMVTAAVRHQMQRPVLARLLDDEEARLRADDVAAPGTSAIYHAVRSVVERAAPGLPADRLVSDLMGLTRGITDMAGRAGEVDAADLEARLNRAVFGYLQAVSPDQ